MNLGGSNVQIMDEIDVPPEEEEGGQVEETAAHAARRELIQNLRRTYSESFGGGRWSGRPSSPPHIGGTIPGSVALLVPCLSH